MNNISKKLNDLAQNLRITRTDQTHFDEIESIVAEMKKLKETHDLIIEDPESTRGYMRIGNDVIEIRIGKDTFTTINRKCCKNKQLARHLTQDYAIVGKVADVSRNYYYHAPIPNCKNVIYTENASEYKQFRESSNMYEFYLNLNLAINGERYEIDNRSLKITHNGNLKQYDIDDLKRRDNLSAGMIELLAANIDKHKDLLNCRNYQYL